MSKTRVFVNVQLPIDRTKEYKGCVRYLDKNAEGITNIYVSKSVLPDPAPEAVIVQIAAAS